MNYNMLKKLCNINAMPTQEAVLSEYIKTEVKSYVDEVYEDSFGNLIAHKKGNGKRLMIAAHMDQIGFMIKSIEEKGYLRFNAVGGLIPFTLIGQRVMIDSHVVGVIGTDFNFESGRAFSKISIEDLFIDIGESSKDEAIKRVEIGNFGTFATEFYENEEMVISKALDDRIGCFILIELIHKNIQSEYDLYYVFTVQEEVGTRGAITASYTIEPHIGLSIDITGSEDLPGVKISTAKLGQGVGIKLMDPSLIIHPDVKSLLTDVAKSNDIQFQYEIMKRGGTDAGAMQYSKSGVKSGAVSIPTRHAHSGNEMIHKNDVSAAIKLLEFMLQHK